MPYGWYGQGGKAFTDQAMHQSYNQEKKQEMTDLKFTEKVGNGTIEHANLKFTKGYAIADMWLKTKYLVDTTMNRLDNHIYDSISRPDVDNILAIGYNGTTGTYIKPDWSKISAEFDAVEFEWNKVWDILDDQVVGLRDSNTLHPLTEEIELKRDVGYEIMVNEKNGWNTVIINKDNDVQILDDRYEGIIEIPKTSWLSRLMVKHDGTYLANYKYEESTKIASKFDMDWLQVSEVRLSKIWDYIKADVISTEWVSGLRWCHIYNEKKNTEIHFETVVNPEALPYLDKSSIIRTSSLSYPPNVVIIRNIDWSHSMYDIVKDCYLTGKVNGKFVEHSELWYMTTNEPWIIKAKFAYVPRVLWANKFNRDELDYEYDSISMERYRNHLAYVTKRGLTEEEKVEYGRFFDHVWNTNSEECVMVTMYIYNKKSGKYKSWKKFLYSEGQCNYYTVPTRSDIEFVEKAVAVNEVVEIREVEANKPYTDEHVAADSVNTAPDHVNTKHVEFKPKEEDFTVLNKMMSWFQKDG